MSFRDLQTDAVATSPVPSFVLNATPNAKNLWGQMKAAFPSLYIDPPTNDSSPVFLNFTLKGNTGYTILSVGWVQGEGEAPEFVTNFAQNVYSSWGGGNALATVPPAIGTTVYILGTSIGDLPAHITA